MKPWYVEQATLECAAKIRAERDPIWRRYLIEEKKLLLNPDNWQRDGNGEMCIIIPCWDVMIKLLGNEAETARYFEGAA